MLDMLQSVTEKKHPRGTGWRANLPSYTVAGKTGTGQIPVNGHYNHSDYNVSFIGIYPATNPELAILVTIEKPRGSVQSGGGVAAPTFAAVAEEIGHYLSIPADKPPTD
jgi:cell division protein FtsI (penicillin-binding protein 3)